MKRCDAHKTVLTFPESTLSHTNHVLRRNMRIIRQLPLVRIPADPWCRKFRVSLRSFGVPCAFCQLPSRHANSEPLTICTISRLSRISQ